MPTSISITLDTRRVKKKTGKFPVKLLVIHESDPKRYQTMYDLTQEEFNRLSAPRISEKLQQIRNSLKQIQRNAEDAANSSDPFSYEEFEKDFILNNPLFRQRKYIKNVVAITGQKNDDFDFSLYYKKFPLLNEAITEPGTFAFTYYTYIKSLVVEGRISTAISYHCSYQSLKRFRGNARFADITVSYLNQYEQWAKQNGISKSTISIYVRALRAIFNIADAEGIIKKEKCYPFGRRKYRIPVTRNIKKALNLSHIEKIYYYEPACEQERWAMDYWLFCFFANGINPKDVALLKYKNIEGDFIVFERAKTESTSRTDPKPISVYISEDIVAIIERRGNKDKNPDNFIFPILYNGITPLREYDLIEFFIRNINDWMHRICKKLQIDKKVTTIVSRHSFSSILKNAGASTEFIQEALGHTNKKTTENYLDSFENEIKKEFAGKLVSFKRQPTPAESA